VSVSSKYTHLLSESDETKKLTKKRVEKLEAEIANLTYQLDEEKR